MKRCKYRAGSLKKEAIHSGITTYTESSQEALRQAEKRNKLEASEKFNLQEHIEISHRKERQAQVTFIINSTEFLTPCLK